LRLPRVHIGAATLWASNKSPSARIITIEPEVTSPEGVAILSKVSIAKKAERLAKAHVLLLTPVWEGWGLVVTEAAEVGTPSITYDVPGLRDSVMASNGILTAPNPEQLSSALRESLSKGMVSYLPQVSPGGVIPWNQVASRILDLAPTEEYDRITS
jgi:glycosyltransferase involved in cell wall biosynthesis